MRPQHQKLQGSETPPSKTLQIFPWRELTFGRQNRSIFGQKIADPDEANPKVGWLKRRSGFLEKGAFWRRRDFFRVD